MNEPMLSHKIDLAREQGAQAPPSERSSAANNVGASLSFLDCSYTVQVLKTNLSHFP